MFIDDVSLFVKAGKGGDGAVAFRREKYVAKGGPAGGNGGRGGDIVFVGNEGLTTLIDFRYKKMIVADDGVKGGLNKCFGADAKDIVIQVPVGSIIYDQTQGTVIADITRNGQREVICKGGKGGRGNATFATSRMRTPMIAEKGVPGEEREIRIELKILADVGLVGFPSVGKSTIISVVSSATPKIADYPFTTLIPQLGVVEVKGGGSFVMADMPGLIEGASQGAGLGFQFLRHIERTRVIVHVLDMAPLENRDPYEDYLKINKELETFNPKLMLRPQIIAANKMDLPGAAENLKKLQSQITDETIIPISAYTKENLDELVYAIAKLLETIKLEQFNENISDTVIEYKYTPPAPPFVIEKDEDGVYNVTGATIKKYFDGTDFDHDDSVKQFARKIRTLGVDDALRKLGVKTGTTVRIFGYEFEFLD